MILMTNERPNDLYSLSGNAVLAEGLVDGVPRKRALGAGDYGSAEAGGA